MVIHHDARPILDRIEKFMKIKESSVGDPDINLGDKLKKVHMDNNSGAGLSAPLNMSRRLCAIVKSI